MRFGTTRGAGSFGTSALGDMGDRLHVYYRPLMEKLEQEKREAADM
jgi:hypothetical protein